MQIPFLGEFYRKGSDVCLSFPMHNPHVDYEDIDESIDHKTHLRVDHYKVKLVGGKQAKDIVSVLKDVLTEVDKLIKGKGNKKKCVLIIPKKYMDTDKDSIIHSDTFNYLILDIANRNKISVVHVDEASIDLPKLVQLESRISTTYYLKPTDYTTKLREHIKYSMKH